VKIKSLGLKISLIVALMIALIIFGATSIVKISTDNLVRSLTESEAEAAAHALEAALDNYQNEAFIRAQIIASS